ncbi:MAG: metal-dependent transcriptional regulator [Actinomycetales bacterium]|nr:metal-dependent transcriptional regulator [Actinomycetales bacterium]
MTDMIDTTEMYLRTILELEEEGIVPLRARLAERLGHSGPTVSQTVARMERDGLVAVSDDRHLALSEGGRLAATRVMRKHRLAERLLVEVLGLEWELAHSEACRWEHVITDHVERRILAVLGAGSESPYGNPIPGLAELGADADAPAFRDGVVPLVDALGAWRQAADGSPELVVLTRRIGEPVQADHAALSLLTVAGLVPGGRTRVSLQGGLIRAVADGDQGGVPVTITAEIAASVFVEQSSLGDRSEPGP